MKDSLILVGVLAALTIATSSTANAEWTHYRWTGMADGYTSARFDLYLDPDFVVLAGQDGNNYIAAPVSFGEVTFCHGDDCQSVATPNITLCFPSGPYVVEDGSYFYSGGFFGVADPPITWYLRAPEGTVWTDPSPEAFLNALVLSGTTVYASPSPVLDPLLVSTGAVTVKQEPPFLPCYADLNADSVVDDQDFVVFAAAYERLVCWDGHGDRPPCPEDFNHSSLVDDTDFVLFVVQYNDLVCP